MCTRRASEHKRLFRIQRTQHKDCPLPLYESPAHTILEVYKSLAPNQFDVHFTVVLLKYVCLLQNNSHKQVQIQQTSLTFVLDLEKAASNRTEGVIVNYSGALSQLIEHFCYCYNYVIHTTIVCHMDC